MSFQPSLYLFSKYETGQGAHGTFGSVGHKMLAINKKQDLIPSLWSFFPPDYSFNKYLSSFCLSGSEDTKVNKIQLLPPWELPGWLERETFKIWLPGQPWWAAMGAENESLEIKALQPKPFIPGYNVKSAPTSCLPDTASPWEHQTWETGVRQRRLPRLGVS